MNCDEFFHKLPPRSAMEVETLQIAYWLSETAHREQKRDDGKPYFVHPCRVALSLIEHNRRDTDTLVLALLHDIFEDTNTPNKVIINLFGTKTWDRLSMISKKIPKFDPVTGMVVERMSKATEAYYAGIASADLAVRITKLADRLDNISDMQSFDLMRRCRYIDETRTFLIPIGRSTCPIYTRELELCCNNASI